MAFLSLVRNGMIGAGPENVGQLKEHQALERWEVCVFARVAELGLKYMLTFHLVTVSEENHTTVLSDTKSLWVSGANSPTQSREKE